MTNCMVARIKKWIPDFVVVPFILTWVADFLVFYIGKLSPVPPVEIDIALDQKIPFIPAFIVVYVLAFVQWAAGYIIIMRDGRDTTCRVFSGEILAKLITFVFFIFMPTVIERPEVTGHGVFDWMTRFVYAVDTPKCLFPSIHCLASWICWRGTFYMKRVSKPYRICMFLFTLLVFASVVLVKQHYIVDVAAGVAVAEIGLFLAPRLKLDQLFENCCTAIERCWKARSAKKQKTV